MDAVVNVRGLRMSYGPHEVLRGIDLEVRRGETVALLGPNGAGKTTTLEVLEGFRLPSAGEVEVLGVDPARGDDAWRARIGVVLQNWRDHPRWQVEKLLGHVAAHYPNPWRTGELLDALGLSGKATAKVGQLSGGQRRRLDVALGVVGRPELLFLDEPTTGFDPEARREFHDLVRGLDTTILLTTHDLAEAERLADRITVLVEGHVAVSGTPAELAAAVRAPSRVRWRGGCELTDDPSRLAWELHQRYGGPVPDLEIRRPTLEESYLSLIDRSAA
ncbi:ABC transporter ATP-binding protein [Streptosporangium saharense]|uniref:ABC-2 type transport system ATP-binding protein n=1 Tax=Streptosporangium saharense TaxID=1706840 RepID=A0A7W7QQE7_9ACTN|nr:ABC transporter ATP-binding protein [Streptosporangium saharense]MBB4917875.1 ABC-2 type transport system ATP-binding protein [Streptosporangium saharense]